jgi:O-antigen ligase
MRYALAACILYWLLSFALTGDYARNLRTIEWALTASIVFMLGQRRSYLATALVGVGLSGIMIGITLLPFGDRLGMSGKVEGLQWGLGNPIVLGIPLALFILFCIAERGKWLGLENNQFWRVLFLVVAGCLLLLTTSRGSWFILLVGMIAIGTFDRLARIQMFYALGIFALLLMILPLLNISRYANVQHYLAQTFSPDTSIEKRTTGRVDQWRALPAILSDSPVWGVGPGGGRAASLTYAHKNIIFHSLYLQVAAETGILGIPLLILLLGTTLTRAWIHFRKFGEIVPLLGIMSFIVMGLSVEGLDILGGTLLGVGLVGGNSADLWIVREKSAEL